MAAPTTAPDVRTWQQHYATPQGRRYHPSEELVRFVGRRGGDLGDRVLEVGCGNGANLWFLAEHAGHAAGLDLNAQALGEARQLARRRGCGQEDGLRSRPGRRVFTAPATVTRGRIDALPFADETFDGVADLMVSQHVPFLSHRSLYREYRRVVKPGGWLFLYHLTSRTTGRAGAGADKDFPDHQRVDLFPDAGFTCLPHADALARMVRMAGFDVTDHRGLSREYPDGAVAHYAVIEGVAARL